MSDPIFVQCPCCDGAGVVAVGTHYDYWQGPSTIEEPCDECGGTGSAETEGEPATLEDLEYENFLGALEGAEEAPTLAAD